MKKGLFAVMAPVLAIFAIASSSAMADGRGHGARSVGVWHGSAYPAWRGYYGGWRGAYRAPAAGFYFGGPLYGGVWPYAYRYPYGYGYAPYVVPYTAYVAEEPVVYVERPAEGGTPVAESSPPTSWFYCTDPAGYHPYVQNCSKPWLQVVPQADTGTPPQLAR